MALNREEAFKISKSSICNKCSNIEKKCDLVWKVCGTDSKIGKSYVQSCTRFNDPDFDEKEKVIK